MNERDRGRCRRMSGRDRQALVAAYLPIIVFGAVLIAGRASGTRRPRLQAVLR